MCSSYNKTNQLICYSTFIVLSCVFSVNVCIMLYWILCSLPKKEIWLIAFFGSLSLVVGEWVLLLKTFLLFLSPVHSQSDSIHNEIVVFLPFGLLTVNHHQLTIALLRWKKKKVETIDFYFTTNMEFFYILASNQGNWRFTLLRSTGIERMHSKSEFIQVTSQQPSVTKREMKEGRGKLNAFVTTSFYTTSNRLQYK